MDSKDIKKQPTDRVELVKKKTRVDIPQREIIRVCGSCDKAFLITVLILLAFGSVMIFSASYAYASSYWGDSYHYIKRQLIFAGLGIVAMWMMYKVDYKLIKLASVPIFLASLGLMLLVTFSPLGQAHKGAARWLSLGPIQFQPSEIMKIAVVVILADYISKYYSKIKSNNVKERFIYGVVPYVIVGGIVGASFVLQDHLSGAIIVMLIIACMMFLGGTDLKIIGILGGICVGALCIIVPLFLRHSLARFTAWPNPFVDPLGKGWQPIQSLYAISSGGLWGVGFGASKQKQLYLSEPMNDYIFAVLCEELGFIGALCAICIFIFLIYRGVKIALRAPDKFSSLLVAGIIFHVGLQVVLNICVVTNTIPSTGIALPFFSYGGTSLMILLAEMGIVLNVSRYSLQEK